MGTLDVATACLGFFAVALGLDTVSASVAAVSASVAELKPNRILALI